MVSTQIIRTAPSCTFDQGFLSFGVNLVSISLQGNLWLLRARPKLAADELSVRELEVALKFSSGSDYKTIAQELSVSPSTIKGHLNKIYNKLGINEKASLAVEIRRITH